jgi:hypothetical protein
VAIFQEMISKGQQLGRRSRVRATEVPYFKKVGSPKQPFQRAIAADPSGSVQLPADLEI